MSPYLGPERRNNGGKIEVDPDVLRRLEHESRKAYRFSTGGWAAIGLIIAWSGMRFFLSPDPGAEVSSVNRSLSGLLDDVWNGMWVIGGLLMMFGVLRPHRWGELVGQALFASSCIPFLVAVLVDTGGTPPGWYLGLALMTSAWLRVVYLARYRVRVEQVAEGLRIK